MQKSRISTSRVVDHGFTIQQLADFLSDCIRAGHSPDAKVRARVIKAFHSDGGMLRTVTVASEETDVAK